MQSNQLLTLVLSALDDGKGKDIKVIDVREKTNITDYMVIAIRYFGPARYFSRRPGAGKNEGESSQAIRC